MSVNSYYNLGMQNPVNHQLQQTDLPEKSQWKKMCDVILAILGIVIGIFILIGAWYIFLSVNAFAWGVALGKEVSLWEAFVLRFLVHK